MDIEKEIRRHADKEKAKLLARFFKTGRGEYGEGDVFLGLNVPVSRKIAEKYPEISLSEIDALLKNKIHEIRLIALLILIQQYKKSDANQKRKIVDFYLAHTKYINNWDLVDLSAPRILGDFLFKQKDKKILLVLAKSKNLWKQRIAIISTLAFICKGDAEWTYKLAKIFLRHKHDLIHKATGWMLREAGKRVSEKDLRAFLDARGKEMPRTMLRYAIERLPKSLRLKYLKKDILTFSRM